MGNVEYELEEEASTPNENVEFFILSSDFEFLESFEDKPVRLLATVMELNKASLNGKVYRIEEGKTIAKSLIGNDVYYGVDWAGRHCNPILRKEGKCSKSEPVGTVESTFVEGNKIKATIEILNESLIQALKNGVKFLFSVGGNAVKQIVKKIGGKLVSVMYGARCNHLQIINPDTKVGFPKATVERLLSINETVMMCKDSLCAVPKQDGMEYYIGEDKEYFLESEHEKVENNPEVDLFFGLPKYEIINEDKGEIAELAEKLDDIVEKEKLIKELEGTLEFVYKKNSVDDKTKIVEELYKRLTDDVFDYDERLAKAEERIAERYGKAMKKLDDEEKKLVMEKENFRAWRLKRIKELQKHWNKLSESKTT